MEEQLKILKALANETRFQIVEFLLDGPKCVCEIIPYTKKTQSTVSIYLNDLNKAGILKSRKEGKKVFYFISDKKVCDVFKALGNSKAKIGKKSCCCNDY